MRKLIVVDRSAERRADIVDALCELPGIEAGAAEGSVDEAIREIDRGDIDIVVTVADLPMAEILALTDHARRQRAIDLVVLLEEVPLLPGLIELWQELGARRVVGSIAELAGQVTGLAGERQRGSTRHLTLARQLALTAHDLFATAHGDATSSVPVVIRTRQQPQAPRVASIADVLADAPRRWSYALPAEVQLAVEIGAIVPRVRCTPRDVELIAQHLVLDACGALPLGGTVWLCGERCGPSQVRLAVLESSNRPRTPGAGLDIIRTLAHRNGGDVRDVDLGGATSIEVLLPAVVARPS
jgi:hypothetical protein